MKVDVKPRQANIEFLRILAMLMILTLHYFNQGGILEKILPSDFNYWIVWSLEGICYVSVNCFMLISGYFLWKVDYNWKKILLFWIQIFFYSLLLFAICIFTGISEFSFKNLIYAILPIFSRNNWFVTVYFAMYLLIPLLNSAIKAFSKQDFLRLIIVTNILFCIVPTIVFKIDQFGVAGGYSILWYMNLYLTAAYFSKYNQRLEKHKPFLLLVVSFALLLLLPISKFVLGIVSSRFGDFFDDNMLYKYNSIPVCGASYLLFLFFTRITIKSQKFALFTTRVAKRTFVVFYIHSYFLLREYLWIKLGSLSYYNSLMLIPHMIVSVVLVFAVCSIIDIIREKLFMLIHVDLLIDKLSEKILKKAKE